jgi:hypothetical protein
MTKKTINPNRIGIYVHPKVRQKMIAVGKKLHESGVFGIVDNNGEVLPSALFRYFVEREAKTLNINDEDAEGL